MAYNCFQPAAKITVVHSSYEAILVLCWEHVVQEASGLKKKNGLVFLISFCHRAKLTAEMCVCVRARVKNTMESGITMSKLRNCDSENESIYYTLAFLLTR